MIIYFLMIVKEVLRFVCQNLGLEEVFDSLIGFMVQI